MNSGTGIKSARNAGPSSGISDACNLTADAALRAFLAKLHDAFALIPLFLGLALALANAASRQVNILADFLGLWFRCVGRSLAIDGSGSFACAGGKQQD
jgi:hypothetical protein